jgi:large subunit ribosomal protein L22
MNVSTEKKGAYAISKYIRMSPHKVRRVLNQIRGRSYKEALLILEFMPYASCKPVAQVLQSAGSNAQNNMGLSKNKLVVNETYCDPGPILRRFRPRSQGRGFKIQKPTCHIYVSVSEAN